MAFQSGTVIRTRDDGNYLVGPTNERKLVQVKGCLTSITIGGDIDFALTAMRPKETTDLGIFVNEETKGSAGIKDGMLVNYFRQNAYPWPVIPEIIEATYASMPELLEQFSGHGEIPLMHHIIAEYISMYKVRTPFQEKHGAKGVELIAELAHNEYVKIHPPHNQFEGSVFYQKVDTVSNLVVLPVSENYYYVLHLIAGDMCKKQLQEWNLTDSKLKGFF